MTEKRFKVNADYLNNLDSIIDNETGIEHDYLEIEELLNGLNDENEQLKFENNELKCALALMGVDYIIAEGKKINIPPYYEFEQRYDLIMHRREYDGYD